ncbi:hypothetical protein LTR64_007080 [Lithohypha guttulata]|uniref:Dipeptidyl peptidase 3 n=1 Tax=Lithohypha guttulata TaxID=1690604 RepID=A0AAN7YA43_9EURO|nr:hypothetical protein LTR51_004364 [Lithohypha guttulata]KAK5090972.1 hypothetical protein LTR05_001150 [Lithohypha guttulata]
MTYDKTAYYADHPPTVVRLEIKPHFEALNQQQKQYAHHLSRAAFAGQRVVLAQVSPESPPTYDLILAIHKACKGDYQKLAEKTGVPSDDVALYLEYAAQFLGNSGNYKSFGDSKFIPRLSPDQFEKLCNVSDSAKELYQAASNAGGGIFETQDAGLMHLGYTDQGHMTTYYPDSPEITKEEIQIIQDVMESVNLMPENTRLRKEKDGNFSLLIASGIQNPPSEERDLGDKDSLSLTGKLDGKKLNLVFGDHLNEMAKAALEIKRAEKVALNDTEKSMLEEYAKSFAAGSMNAHVDSQRWWIKDKKPMVESNIGFIETYRDPHGVRGEWEGLVAMVNLERTKAFSKLVETAPEMIPKLPWSKEFEKDSFLAPDFTSLEVLTFAGSGIPAGINIPNYDKVRQTEGFKNVSLGNVLSAKAPNEPIPFIRKEDDEVYRSMRDPAFEVQVGIHELLGHGCGKLLQETSLGVYNFDKQKPPVSPLTGEPIKTWYKPGQTWGSVFGATAGSYEECRAECVAMALSCDFDILKIFGFGDGTVDMNSEAGNVLYAAYLSMARAGITALEFWDPKSRKWGQPHMQARFSILKTFINAGKDFVSLKSTKDDMSDLEIHLNRDKILSTGRKAVEAYLQKLHIYKATADVESGVKMYNEITSVDEWWAEKVRPVVLSKKIPRKVFVQANTYMDSTSGNVTLKEYEPSCEGMIQSFFDRDV